MLELEFTDGAIDDYEKAFNWYAGKSERAAVRFVQSFEAALQDIANRPKLWVSVSKRVRFRKLNRYPYYVFYRLTRSTAFIVAVAHGRQRLGYWKRRKKN